MWGLLYNIPPLPLCCLLRLRTITAKKKYGQTIVRGRLPIYWSPPLSGYRNKTNIFTGKIISKHELGVCTPTIMTNMDIIGLHYRRGNVIWVKLGTESIWKTRMRMVSYILNPWFLYWTAGSTYATPGGSLLEIHHDERTPYESRPRDDWLMAQSKQQFLSHMLYSEAFDEGRAKTVSPCFTMLTSYFADPTLGHCWSVQQTLGHREKTVTAYPFV